MIYEEIIKPNLNDFSRDGRLSPVGMLRIFEDIGTAHSEAVGDGIVAASIRGTAWVLTDWRLEIVRDIRGGKELKAVTWSESSSSTIATARHYNIFDTDGNLCFKGTSKWVLFDLNAQKIVRIPSELIDMYEGEKKANEYTLPAKKLREPKEFDSELEITLRRSDIDFNRHVHNLRYVDFALESLPQDIYDRSDFAQIRVTYKQQVKEGESIICRYSHEDKVHVVGIYGADNVLRTIVELTDR